MVVSRARRGHLLAIVAHNPWNLEKTFNNFSLRHWEFAWYCSQKWFTNEGLLNHSLHDINKLHPWCSRKMQFLSSPHKQSGTWDYCLGVCSQSFCFKHQQKFILDHPLLITRIIYGAHLEVWTQKLLAKLSKRNYNKLCSFSWKLRARLKKWLRFLVIKNLKYLYNTVFSEVLLNLFIRWSLSSVDKPAWSSSSSGRSR